MASRFGRPSPDPWFGSPIELSGSHVHHSLDLVGIGKTLSRERIATGEAPPALLQVEPTGTFGNEHVLEAWIVCQPDARLQAVMAASIGGENDHVSTRIIGFDGFEQFNIMRGMTRGCTSGQLFAIAYPQCAIDPDLLQATTVLQGSFDAMAVR